MRVLLLAFLALYVAGCSLTREVPPSMAYTLEPQVSVEASSETACRDKVLRVALIQSPKWLKSTDILYKDTHQRRYRYVNARWEQTPTDQLQQVVENALTDSELYKGVIPYRSLAKNSWLLEVRLEQMSQQIADDGSATTELKLYAVLIDQYSRELLAQRRFQYTSSQRVSDVDSTVASWSHSTAFFVPELTQWLEGECTQHSEYDGTKPLSSH